MGTRLNMAVGGRRRRISVLAIATLVLVAVLILHAVVPASATSRTLAEDDPDYDPKTHHHHWTVVTTNVTRNNETVAVTTVNGMFPGPTVHVNEGDTLVVKVTNKVDTDVTIHWHGIKQLRSNWVDGPVYITQCPLTKGQSQIYEFTVPDQSGTYFWHAHDHWLRGTVYGALIVHPREKTPYATPAAELPIVFGEWYGVDPNVIEADAMVTHKPNFVPSYTAPLLNGLPGPLYNGSHGQTMKVKFVAGKTYLLRLVNGALNNHYFFTIANHTMTVVAADGVYVKQFVTKAVLLSPGQSTDVLVTANQPKGEYYFAISEWDSSPVPFYVPPSPALGVIRYKNASPSQKTPYSADVPSATDTLLASSFRSSLFGLTNYTLPEKMDRDLVFAVGVAQIVCKPDENCAFFKGKKLGGSINNVTFDNPTNSSILESFFYHTKGVYTTDFPPVPPAIVNFTSTSVVASYSVTSHRGAKTLKLKYNETVQLVLQDLDSLSLEDHPFHLHGHNFYVVGTGMGNFNAMTDQKKFNLVDPPMRHTVTLPYGGWVAIRFIANNPGVWFLHCHIERHVSWGMMMAFITENGEGEDAKLPGPKHPLPTCNSKSFP